jgi:hypothetical protein
MASTVNCPACDKVIAAKGIPKHTNGCPAWPLKFPGVPPSKFDFNRHFRRGLWGEGLTDQQDYVRCLLCESTGEPEFRALRLFDHLRRVHNEGTVQGYLSRFPGSLVVAPVSRAGREATVKARYGVTNVSKAPEVQKLLRANNRSQDLLAQTKRKVTNLARYGHENPFASTEVKDRIKDTLMQKYGVENPQQAAEIRARTEATSLERFGAKNYVETPEFKVKFKAASQAAFGTDHPMQSEEGQRLCFAGVRARHGVDSVFQLPHVQQKAYTSNVNNHGGVHSQQVPEVLEKARKTWLEKYGVDNPSKVEEIKIRIKDVWMGKYGVPFPPQSLWTNREQRFPNFTEMALQTLCPVNVVYAGDGSYWVRAAGESRARNPDFVVLTPEQVRAWQGGAKLNDLRTYAVIEMFGDYWHGPKRTGVDRETHKNAVIDYYKRAGITCLVLWESEIKAHPMRVAARIRTFLFERLPRE